MSRGRRTAALAAFALAALVAPAARGEEVESPLYKSWARHRPGTRVVLRTVTGSAETTARHTLVSVDDREAVVEMVVVTASGGETVENPPQRLVHRRMFPVLPGVKKDEIGRPPGTIARGEESIEVAGRSYRADWFDSKGQTEAGESITRTWMSDEVPGKLLKAVTRVPKVNKTTTIELVEFEAP